MPQNPFELFRQECPELAARFGDLVNAQRQSKGLDDKTRQLVCIAVNAANRNPIGVRMHAPMARKAGATRHDVIAAVMMNLHLSGLAAVLDSLPAAVEGYDA